MLFDLEATGRRRAVKIIYTFLAVLIGGGLILFGVGGSGFGLLNSDQNSGNGGNSGASLESQAKKSEQQASAPALPGAKTKLTDAQQAALWAKAAQLRFQAASAGFDTTTGAYSDAAKTQLQSASTDWQRYLSLQKGKVNLTLAKLMAQAYGVTALNDGKNGVNAWQIVVTAEPTGPNYSQLALAAYLSGNNKIGNEAAARAVALTPKSQRSTLKNQFIAAKAQFKLAKQQAAKQAAQQSSGSGNSLGGLGG